MWDAMAGTGAFVALGDSFTEGLGDPYPDGTGYRGWADRLAERLAVDRPGLLYANLAARGKMLREGAGDQVPRAVAMAPDLVSLAAGSHDLRRRTAAADHRARRATAAARGCRLVDLGAVRALAAPRAWSLDRLHLAPDGHRRVALRASEVVGLPVDEDWREPLPSGPVPWAAAP